MNNVKVGDSIETMRDGRAIGGNVHRVNTGVVTRLTPTQVIIRNEHGNVQRFSRATGAAIPQVDWLCPEYMTVASKTETHQPIKTVTHLKIAVERMGGRLEEDEGIRDLRCFQLCAPEGKLWINTDLHTMRLDWVRGGSVQSAQWNQDAYNDAIERMSGGVREMTDDEREIYSED